MNARKALHLAFHKFMRLRHESRKNSHFILHGSGVTLGRTRTSAEIIWMSASHVSRRPACCTLMATFSRVPRMYATCTCSERQGDSSGRGRKCASERREGWGGESDAMGSSC